MAWTLLINKKCFSEKAEITYSRQLKIAIPHNSSGGSGSSENAIKCIILSK
jgi:hypothetical protein